MQAPDAPAAPCKLMEYGQLLMTWNRIPKTALIKAIVLLVFVMGSILLMRYTPLSEFIKPDQLNNLVKNAGPWAPLAFIAVYTVAICLFVPGMVLATLSAALFGTYWGFVYGWLGAICSSTASFLIARYLGRDFAASVVGDRLRGYDDTIEARGFTIVLALRMACFPFTILNFGLGVTKIRFRDFFWGTALGMIVITFVITFWVGTLKAMWLSGHWDHSLLWQIPLITAVFLLSLLVPRTIQKRRSGTRM